MWQLTRGGSADLNTSCSIWSQIVPCFHRKKLRYRAVFVYDDGEEDISQFFGPTNAFIAKVKGLCHQLRLSARAHTLFHHANLILSALNR